MATRTALLLNTLKSTFHVDAARGRVYICVQRGKQMTFERNSRKLIQMLKAQGFEEVSQRGSHLKLRKGDVTVIVPHPKKDLPMPMVRSIYQQAGLS